MAHRDVRSGHEHAALGESFHYAIPRNAIPSRFSLVVAANLAATALLLASTTVAPPRYELALAPARGGWVVASVPLGGPAWSVGVRPGMRVASVEPASASIAEWRSLLLTDGTVEISLPRPIDPPGPAAVFAALVLVVLTSLLRRAAPTASWLLVLAALAAVMWPLARLSAVPADLGVLAVTPAVALLAFDDGSAVHRRARALASAGLAAALLGSVTVVMLAPDDWSFVTPAWQALAGVDGALLAGAAAVDAWRRAGELSSVTQTTEGAFGRRISLAIDELVPGRAGSRWRAGERERVRIAQRIHREVLGELAAAKREVSAVGSAPAAASLDRATRGLRALMNEEASPVLEAFGLVAAAESAAELALTRDRLRVEIDVRADDGRPPFAIESAAFAVLREALSNAAAHAGDGPVAVVLDVARDRVHVAVRDSGSGFAETAVGEAARSGHRGLLDMRAASDSVGGMLSVSLSSAGGTVVSFRWPA